MCIFTKVIKSRYKHTLSFKTDLTQEDAVGFSLDGTVADEVEVMAQVQEFITRHPENSNPIFSYNPCDYGMYLTSVKKGNIHMNYNLLNFDLCLCMTR